MMIQVRCPNPACANPLQIHEDQPAEESRCPLCGQRFRLRPASTLSPERILTIPAPAPAGVTATLPPTEPLPAQIPAEPERCESATLSLAAEPPARSADETLDDPTAPRTLSVAVAPVETAPLPAVTAEPTLPARVGRFEIRGRLGEGAFGQVYRAYDPQLDREVALKVAKPDTLTTPRRVERFLREAKSAAQLRHPHIVPVFDAGRDGDRYYIASAFINGQTLEAAIAQGGIDCRRAAQLVRQLAEALGYAHSLGIVHRDVKPANLMLDEKGQPLVMDFGLAARQEEAEKLTHDGAVLGTPLYMAPEQAKGQGGEALPASDQYGLGVLLYELLCGKTPFGGPPQVVLFNHIHAEPPAPRKVNRKVPKDLETVCLKCLEKEPARRYADCQALADDLRRWLENEPIQARPLNLAERVVRWAKREPKLAATVALAAGLLATVVVVILLSLARINAALEGTQTALTGEKRARKKLDVQLSQAARFYCDYSDTEFQKGKVRESLNWVLRAYQTAPKDDPLRASYRHLLAAQGRGLEKVLPHLDQVVAVAYSPDGRTVLTGSGKTAQLWEAASGKPLAALRHQFPVTRVAFSPDGRTVLTESIGTVQLWEAASGKLLASFYHFKHASVTAVAFSPDSRTVLTGSADKTARLWEAATGKPLASLRHDGPVWAVAYSPDGRTVLTGSDGTARLWEAASAKLLVSLRHPGSVTAVAYSPDGRTVLTGGYDKTARLWEAASGKPLATLRHEGRVFTVAYSPDGRTVLTGSFKEARLWEAATGKSLATLRQQGEVHTVAYSPDGRTVLTRSFDKTARLWEAASGKPLASLCHEGAVLAAAFSPDGRTVLTGSLDKTARLWEVARGKPLTTLRHEGYVKAVAYSPDGCTVLTGCWDKTAWLWETATGKLLATLRHEGWVVAVAYSPDGRTVLTGSGSDEKGGEARLWEVASGKPLATLRHDSLVNAVAYSPDSRTVLTGSKDNKARLWAAPSGKLLAILRHEYWVRAVAYSPDGHIVLTGSGNGLKGEAQLWQAASGKLLTTLPHDGPVETVAFSPDGRTVLTGSADKTARLWEAATGKLLGALPHTDSVYAAAFSPNGRTILTSSADKTARLWEVPAPAPDQPARLQAWVRWQTGLAFDDRGVLLPLSPEERLRSWQELQKAGGDWRFSTSPRQRR